MSADVGMVMAIQRAVGVKADGVFGPKTAAAVLAALEKKGI